MEKVRLVPLVPLDDPGLANGPYDDASFQSGNVSLDDYGKLYGYMYRPFRFTGDYNGVVGISSSHPTVMKDGVAIFGDRFPFFSKRSEAVELLKRHEYYGHVRRYCNDPASLRKEMVTVTVLTSCDFTYMAEPTICDGVTDIVNAPSATEYHGHLLEKLSPVIHVVGQ